MKCRISSISDVRTFLIQQLFPLLLESSLQGTIPCYKCALFLIIFRLKLLLVHQSLSSPSVGEYDFDRLELLLFETLLFPGLFNFTVIRLIQKVLIVDLAIPILNVLLSLRNRFEPLIIPHVV
jgi:hypothetical protein